MLAREIKIIDGIPLLMCPLDFVPELQLWDRMEDGTKRYIINFVLAYVEEKKEKDADAK